MNHSRARAVAAINRLFGYELSRGIGIRINVTSDDEDEDSLHSNTSDDQDIEEEQALLFALDRQSEGELSNTDFRPVMEPQFNIGVDNQHGQNDVDLVAEPLATPANPSQNDEPSSSVPEPRLYTDISSTAGDQVASTSSPESAADTGRSGDGAPDSKVKVGACPEPSKGKGKKRKKEVEVACDEEEDQNGQSCPICMDDWSNSGTHRMCCLKCGHIYGESCIRRWLTSASAASGRCPQCNAKAKLRDIRPLFARTLRAIDTAERDRLADQLEDSRRDKERLQLEITRLNIATQMQQAEVKRLQVELDQLIRARVGSGMTPLPLTGYIPVDGNTPSTALEGIGQDGLPCHFSLVNTVEISREGGCRVAAFCDPLNLMVVSQRSTNPLFPGFGLKKVDALEFRATQFVPAHQKPIRDLAFAPSSRSLLLSASFDCTARLLDLASGSNSVVATLAAESPLWSCCWDACDPNLLHVGSQGGMILSFDIRSTAAPVSRKSHPEDITPIIALVPIPPSPGRSLPLGGLVSCHLSSCWAHDISSNESQSLPFDGPFTGLRYEPITQHFLISSRPCARAPHARHHVCERAHLRPNEDNVISGMCNPPVHTFLGGTTQKVLSRPCLVPVGRDLLVVAHQESSSTVALWSVGRGARVATIPASDPVIDVCPLVVNREAHVALLTEKVLRMYKIR